MDFAFDFVRADAQNAAVVPVVNAFLSQRTNTTRLTSKKVSTFNGLIHELQTNSTVTTPIGDLLIAGHANHEGEIQIPMFSGQKGLTTFDVLVSTLSPTGQSITIPAGVMGTSSNVHIRGCNVGKDQSLLNEFKLAFGGAVNVTAPLFFDEFRLGRASGSAFEFMCYEFFINSAIKLADKAAMLAAFVAKMNALATAGTPWSFLDGTAVTSDNLKAWIGEGTAFNDERSPANLGQSVGSGKRAVKSLPVKRSFRIEKQVFTWNWTFATTATLADSSKLQSVFATTLANTDPQFKATYGAPNASPKYVRWGYASVPDFIAGFAQTGDPKKATAGTWHHEVKNKGLTLVSTGTRWQYTIIRPVTVAADPKSNLVFNYYPKKPTATDQPIVGLSETNPKFFGKSK